MAITELTGLQKHNTPGGTLVAKEGQVALVILIAMSYTAKKQKPLIINAVEGWAYHLTATTTPPHLHIAL